MDIFPNTTRIDLERQGDHVLAQLWKKGWIEGQWTDQCQYLVDTRIEAVSHQCELAGFTIEMMDGFHGRALRGEITRIDILHIETGWKIDKYPFGWTAKTRPISSRVTDKAEAARAIACLRENGWTIRNWPNGLPAPGKARASLFVMPAPSSTCAVKSSPILLLVTLTSAIILIFLSISKEAIEKIPTRSTQLPTTQTYSTFLTMEKLKCPL